MKAEEESNIEYLKIDENTLKGNNLSYIGNSIYIIHYPNNTDKDKAAVSYGIIIRSFEDKEYSFVHFSHAENGSSVSPILSLSNNKIIGIHKGRSDKAYNFGSFLFDAINEFINKYKKKNIIKKINLKEIDNKNVFIKLYNKRLIKDFIKIKNDKKKIKINIFFSYDILYKFLMSKKIDMNKNKWITAWNGTNYKYLDSIIKYGLKPPEIKLEDGTFTPKTKYIPDKELVNEIQNWENAFLASGNKYSAKSYSSNRCILEVKK